MPDHVVPENDSQIARIKSGPHWRFVLRPKPYVENRLQLEDCLRTVQSATVRFRGWDFPHFNTAEQPVMGTDFVATEDAFRGHLEYWRAYTSGQLIYLSSIRETTDPDWQRHLLETAPRRIMTAPADLNWSEVPGFIDLVNFVYTITEFVEFAARLAPALPQTESARLDIGLHHIRGFVLTVDDPRRAWWEYYAANEQTLETSREVGISRLVSSSSEVALDTMKWFLVRFGWLEPNMEAMKSDMEQLTQRSSR